MTYDNANEIIKETFDSLLSSYQIGLEISVNDSNFIIDGVNLLYCKCHEIYFKCGSLYIYSPEWIKKKKREQIPKPKLTNALNMQQRLH